jgi:hypothetical protein
LWFTSVIPALRRQKDLVLEPNLGYMVDTCVAGIGLEIHLQHLKTNKKTSKINSIQFLYSIYEIIY